MKKIWLILVAGLLITTIAVPVSAWEFSMTGNWRWNYDYIAGGGTDGFFGPLNVAPNLPLTDKWNAMNTWVGARTMNGLQYGLVTGKDASFQWNRVEFFPEIRINKAVRLRGTYQIGGVNQLNPPWADSAYGVYPNSFSYGAWNPIAHGSWTQFWMTAQTPWGILIGGKRAFAFGMGAQYDGNQASVESLGVVAPYGPFRVGVVCYPWRGQVWVNAGAGRQYISTISMASQNDGWNTFNGAQPFVQNYLPWDNEAKMQLEPGVFVTYDSGPLSLGVVYEWIGQHNSPAGATDQYYATGTGRSIFNTQGASSMAARTYDSTVEDGSAFIKYNNGRFFANMELAWVRSQMTVQPGISDSITRDGYGAYFTSDGSAATQKYMESWKWMMEVGALFGPAKLTGFWSWVPGPDRRQGVWIDRQAWENVGNGTLFANPQAYLPYSLLMGYQYGAGLNAISTNGEGYMTDANSYGVRLDYALAANLNMYVSGFYADRVSGGWPWGIMTIQSGGYYGHNAPASGTGHGGGATALLGQGIVGYTAIPANQNVGGSTSAPNIPDSSLGWEVTAGVDWKLLEGLKATLRGAYWQPGAWFKYACVDRAVASSAINPDFTYNGYAPNYIQPTQGDGSGWSVLPSRTIAPIYMFQGTMQVDF